MEQGDRTRLHRVKEGIYQGWNTSFSRLWSWRSVHIDHRPEQGEHCGGVISSLEQIGEVPRMLGEKV